MAPRKEHLNHPFRSRNFGDKTPANIAISRAIKRGHLAPAKTHKCHGCNEQAKDYHHCSYREDDYLCVMPLCRKCHQQVHQSGREIEGGVVPTAVGLVRIAIASSSSPA